MGGSGRRLSGARLSSPSSPQGRTAASTHLIVCRWCYRGRGCSVSCMGSFTYCGIKTIYLPHGTIVGWICGNDIDLISIMFDPVEDRFRQRAVIPAELIEPAARIILRAEDC